MIDFLMDEEEIINYRNIRKIQQIEKNSSTLTNIKNSFYDDIKKYLEKMETLLDHESSPQKKKILREEIENIKKISYNIYEQREKKIIIATISKIRGGKPDLTNITELEKNLYKSLSDILHKSRERFYEKKIETNNDIINQENKNRDKPILNNDEKQKNNNPIVIVNENIPEFIGIDEKKYNLRKNDVLSLPKEICDILIKKDKVKKIK